MSREKISIGMVVLVMVLFGLSLSACSQEEAGSETTTAAGNSWGKNDDVAVNSNVSGLESSPNSPETDQGQLAKKANDGGTQGKGRGREESGDLNRSDQAAENPGQRRGQGQTSNLENVQELESGQTLYQTEGGRFSRGSGNGSGNGRGQGNGTDDSGGGGLGRSQEPLSDTEVNALVRAIEEEFGAQVLYQSVLNSFGDVEPFNKIVQSEAQHAAALIRQAEKYGVAIPEFPSLEGLPEFSTLSDACQAGVAAEIADAALYDDLIPVTTHVDLIRVFENLRNASLDNHLPEFEGCQ